MSGRGQAALVALLIALVATAAIMRSGGDRAPTLASAPCQTALRTAAALAPLATGELAIFRPATTSQNLGTLAFDDAAGRAVGLNSFSGKTVLLNFWATWCVPCRTEMPALDRLQADRGSDAFQVVAVNLDTDSTAGDEQAFLDQIGVLHLAFYADPALALTRQLKTRGLVSDCPPRSWSMIRAANSAPRLAVRLGIR